MAANVSSRLIDASRVVTNAATNHGSRCASDFARLRLLDPDRFYDRNEVIMEAEGYRDVAQLAEKRRGAH